MNNHKILISQNGEVVNNEIANLMDELDLTNFLVFKKENEDGPDIKGGHPDALIIHATRVQKRSDGEFQNNINNFYTVFCLCFEP